MMCNSFCRLFILFVQSVIKTDFISYLVLLYMPVEADKIVKQHQFKRFVFAIKLQIL